MGGRYDSTNIVPKPIVTGITALGLDHTAILGKTLQDIAWQKGGIFKVSRTSYVHNACNLHCPYLGRCPCTDRRATGGRQDGATETGARVEGTYMSQKGTTRTPNSHLP